MKESFVSWEPRSKVGKGLLKRSLEIIEEYRRQGYVLTLRQLYYQMVSRDYLPNRQAEYKRLGELVSNARLGGFIDWDSIVDRGRVPIEPAEWSSPAEIIEVAARQYRVNRWEGQPHYVEVWCEKDALSSVIEPVCNRLHVRFLANRGYSSSSAMYDGAKRLRRAIQQSRQPVVIYLGDHDPSGLDMSRDIAARLQLLSRQMDIRVNRLALNIDQVEEYQPPPNPTKLEDSRAAGYVDLYGMESWELDALDPATLDGLVSDAVESFLDRDLYEDVLEREEKDRDRLNEIVQQFRA